MNRKSHSFLTLSLYAISIYSFGSNAGIVFLCLSLYPTN